MTHACVVRKKKVQAYDPLYHCSIESACCLVVFSKQQRLAIAFELAGSRSTSSLGEKSIFAYQNGKLDKQAFGP